MNARRLAVLAACAVVTSVLSVPSITPAAAGVGETLDFRDMVVDTVRDRFYVAGAGDVGVYDSGAGSLEPVSGTSQTVDLAISADSSRVVATRRSANEIVVIDTLTRSVLRHYPVPSTYCLGASAPVGGRVWFTHSCAGAVDRGLSSIDLATGAIADAPPASSVCGHPTDLVTSPTAPHLLFAICGQRVTRVDLSTSPPSRIESADLGSEPHDVAVTADGAQVVVGMQPNGAIALGTTSLAPVGRYGTTGGQAVATSPADVGLVAVYDDSTPMVRVYRVGSSSALTTYRTPTLGWYAHLAFSADGRHFLVAASIGGVRYRLGMVPAQTAPPSPVVPISPATNGRIAFLIPEEIQWASVLPDGTGRQVRPLDSFEGLPRTLRFSPDGSEVALSNGYVYPRIVLGELEGGFPWKVTNYDSTQPETRDTHPVFSHTGRRVLFQRTMDGEEIWSTDLYDRFPRQQPGTELKAGLLGASEVSVAPDGGLVWQFEEGTSPFAQVDQGIWYLAPTPGATAVRLTNGRSPEIGPDGRTVLFVRRALDDTDQVFVVKTDGTGGAQVTTGTEAEAPAWAPDGKAIAFSQDGVVKILDLTTKSTRTLAPGGGPAWQPLPAGNARDVVLRLGGADRIETAIEVSRSGFPTDGSAGAAVLARSDGFADALVGTPLATAKHGPLLLTPATELDDRVEAEIVRAVPAGGTVYLLGGVGALSQRVADQVTAAGRRVVRLQGANRYATAVAVAKVLGPVDVVLLATGNDFPDALTAGAAAGSYFSPGGSGGAVLLTNGTVMPQEVTAYLAAAKPTTLAAIGGPAATAAPKAIPIVGADRYDTSVQVAYAFFGPEPVIGLASGSGFADALPGGTLLAYVNGPLLLTAPTGLPPGVDYYLHAYSSAIHTAVVLGGTGAISTSLQRAVTSTIGVTTRYQVGGSLAGTLAPGTATRAAASRAVPEAVTPDKPSRPTQRPSLSVPAG